MEDSVNGTTETHWSKGIQGVFFMLKPMMYHVGTGNPFTAL